jgi:D-glycero-D-manno-heptose 1,7-bisphosphate phosphatase
MNLQPAIFLDRDGTLMEEAGYCADPGLVRVFPRVAAALQQLRAAGYLLIVVTNQSGIGRGYFTEAAYRAVQAEFERQILPARLDAVYFCADAPSSASPRRKPAPGMLLEAAKDCMIDLTRSFLVGDKATDIQAGLAAGCRTILVQTGYGRDQTGAEPHFVAATFAQAADLILPSSRP